MKCDFCQEECDGRIILRDSNLFKEDGSDIILCSTCLNLYANHEYDKLTDRIKDKEIKEDTKEKMQVDCIKSDRFVS